MEEFGAGADERRCDGAAWTYLLPFPLPAVTRALGRFLQPGIVRMVGHSHIRRQIRLLTARVIAAERAAGMNSDDTTKAERSMERHVRDRREAVEGEAPDQLVFAFQFAALQIRLRDADDYRVARKMPRA
jgi:hypothetical protein